jgi:hypothetical protein
LFYIYDVMMAGEEVRGRIKRDLAEIASGLVLGSAEDLVEMLRETLPV